MTKRAGSSKPIGGALMTRARKFWPHVLVIAIVVAGCQTVAGPLVNRTDANAPRDPATGILIGAEELTLGPEDAPLAILLVHGFIGGSNNFWELPERLAAEGHRVRAIRLPGHGTTPRDLIGIAADDFLEAVIGEAGALKEKHGKVILAGHSMGGALSTLVASSMDIDGLVLAAPYYAVTRHWYYVLPVETWAQITSPFLPWVYKSDAFIRVRRDEAKPLITSYRWLPRQATRELGKLGRRARDPETLAAITCPVLLIHAEGDEAASPAAARRAFEGMGSENKEFLWLRESDHHIFWDYDREEVVDAVVEFAAKIRDEEPAEERGSER